jgi:hypothetical protein
MGTYGPNFDFRVIPEEESRRGRIVLENGSDVPIGAPLIVANGATPSTIFTGALPAALATGSQAPKRGFAGIGLYEWIDLNQLDPLYYTYSDRSTIPDGRLCQLISNPGGKVVFRNTAARQFLGIRSYAGRTMVAGMGATPTVTVGAYLTPGTGDDTNGYWATTSTAANAWLIVTRVDTARHEVEAELAF